MLNEYDEGSIRVLGKLVILGWPFCKIVAEADKILRPKTASPDNDHIMLYFCSGDPKADSQVMMAREVLKSAYKERPDRSLQGKEQVLASYISEGGTCVKSSSWISSSDKPGR